MEIKFSTHQGPDWNDWHVDVSGFARFQLKAFILMCQKMPWSCSAAAWMAGTLQACTQTWLHVQKSHPPLDDPPSSSEEWKQNQNNTHKAVEPNSPCQNILKVIQVPGLVDEKKKDLFLFLKEAQTYTKIVLTEYINSNNSKSKNMCRNSSWYNPELYTLCLSPLPTKKTKKNNKKQQQGNNMDLVRMPQLG